MHRRALMPVLLVLLLGCGSCVLIHDIGGAEAHKLVDQGALLLDVRTTYEFETSHIEGALSIPLDQLEGRLDTLGPKDRPIVLYCHSGTRAWNAQKLLRDAGYQSVHNLGGYSRWK